VTHGGSQKNGVLSFIARAVREGRPLAVLNAYSDLRFPDLAQVAAAEDFHSLFCIPLRVQQNRVIGAICLYTQEAHHFDYEQVRLLSTFVDEAAIAIETARLYAENQAIKSTILQEVHYHIRNYFQLVIAILTMQQRRLKQGIPGTIALREAIAHVHLLAIANVHNLEDNGNVSTIGVVIQQFVDRAKFSLVPLECSISFEVLGEDAKIDMHRAKVLLMILNWLIINMISNNLAVEGARVTIKTTQRDKEITVEICSDKPAQESPKLYTSSSDLGLDIIRRLVRDDLKGRIELDNQDSLTHARLCFPV
jgi:two-component system, sensor histidine kinase PdtaS